MKRSLFRRTLLLTLVSLGVSSFALANPTLISEEQAIESALEGIGVEVLGIRFDEPDTQWDVFVKSGEQAYEIEIDALTGQLVAKEKRKSCRDTGRTIWRPFSRRH